MCVLPSPENVTLDEKISSTRISNKTYYSQCSGKENTMRHLTKQTEIQTHIIHKIVLTDRSVVFFCDIAHGQNMNLIVQREGYYLD